MSDTEKLMEQTYDEYERDHQDRMDAYIRAMSEMSEDDREALIAEHLDIEERLEWFSDGLEMIEADGGMLFRWPGLTFEDAQERIEWFKQYIWGPRSPAVAKLKARVNQ